jgi:chromosomal replication initiation ATPase DnaA
MSTYSALRAQYDDLEARVIVLEKLISKAFNLKPEELEPLGPSKVHKILDEVAKKHGMTTYFMLNGRRGPKFVEARWEAMYRLRNEVTIHGLPASFPMIARWMGGLDHTTVMHGIRMFAAGNISYPKKRGPKPPS